jgi:hypothetical protein
MKGAALLNYVVISGGNLTDLQHKVKTLTGKPLGDKPVIAVHHAVGGNTYEATVQVELSQRNTLSEKDVQSLNEYIKRRDRSIIGSITLDEDEIDAETPLAGSPSKTVPRMP